LLGADEPAPYSIEGQGGAYAALVVCDHASRRIPRALGTLGLPDSALARHIAWDIGAGALARELARRLHLQAVLAGYSRLVVDCYRHLEDPTSIAPVSDGEAVPGNLGLSARARKARVDELFAPYHRAIDERLSAWLDGERVPALIAIHSFTPVLRGQCRPWHCGVLWDRDPRVPVPLLAALRRAADLLVGDNEPYSGRDLADYTIDVHAERRGWPHVCIEVRQDLLGDALGIERWADLLARSLAPILEDAALYRRAGVARAVLP
jgi:predicted N-formylglutamate amidohydrolase